MLKITKFFNLVLLLFVLAAGRLGAEPLLHVRIDDGQTTASGSITAHQFLPDGQSLAFLADIQQIDEHDLLLADFATRAVLNLSHVPGLRVDVEDLRVAPDGQRIVYWGRDPADDVRRLYSVPVTGGPPAMLAEDLLRSHALTAPFDVVGDSDTVVFMDDRVTTDVQQLWRVPIDGGNVEALSRLPASYLVSPDHQWIALSETYQIPKPTPLNYTALSLLKLDDGTTTPLTIAHSPDGTTPSPAIFSSFAPDSSLLYYVADDSMRCITLPGLAIEQLGKGGADVGEVLPGNDRIITLKTLVTKVPVLPNVYSTVTSATVLGRSRGTTETLTLIVKGYTERASSQAADSPTQRSLSWPRIQSQLDVSPDGSTVLFLFRSKLYSVSASGGEVTSIDPTNDYFSLVAGNGHAVLRGGTYGLRKLDYATAQVSVLTGEQIDKYFFDTSADRLYYSTREEEALLVSVSLPDLTRHVLNQHPSAAFPSFELSPDHHAVVYTARDAVDSSQGTNRLAVAPCCGGEGIDLFNTAIVHAAPVTALVALGYEGNSAFYKCGSSLWRRSSLGTSSVNLGLMNKWAISSSGKYLAYMYHYTVFLIPFGGGFYRTLTLRTVALGPSGVSYTHLHQSGVVQMYPFKPPLSISPDDGFVSTTDIYDNPVSIAVDDAGAPLPATTIASRGSIVPNLLKAASPPITYNGSLLDWSQVVVSRVSVDGRWIALLAPLDGPQKELYAARLPDGEVFKLNRPLYPQTDVEDDFLINANGSLIAYRANEGDGDLYLYATTLVEEAESAFIIE